MWLRFATDRSITTVVRTAATSDSKNVLFLLSAAINHASVWCYELFVCKLKINCANLMHIQQVFGSDDKRVIFGQFQNAPLLCAE